MMNDGWWILDGELWMVKGFPLVVRIASTIQANNVSVSTIHPQALASTIQGFEGTVSRIHPHDIIKKILGE